MIKLLLRDNLKNAYPGVDFDILIPPDSKMGDYSVNLAFVLAKKEGGDPKEIGERLVKELSRDKELKRYFGKIEFAPPGFINFYLSEDYLKANLSEAVRNKNYGYNEAFKGKKILVEFTDPNPFKLFHIGHLMPNIIGESMARLYEASGANVVRVNYQGDVGLHVAKAIAAMMPGRIVSNNLSLPKDTDSLTKKMEYLGKAYAVGASAYESGDEAINKEIHDINKKIYDRSDPEVNRLYDLGKGWSLEYFETIYKRLGTKFEHYFFESETAKDGLKIVNENKKIFTESDGALIFKGEDYGLHSRVFVNSQGLPTYETKELGLNKKKFEMYSPDLSIIITGNEVNDYFKVLLKVMELTIPDVARKTQHIGHGMMRFAGGKMSSRTGKVIAAESLIDDIIQKIKNKDGKSSVDKSNEDCEIIAVGAIKYSILRQSIGQDIIFDFDRALSISGDSAPYIQYAGVRLKSIFEKSKATDLMSGVGKEISDMLKQPEELSLMRKISRFPEVVAESAVDHQINRLATYTYELASELHNFYEKHRVIQDDEQLQSARVYLSLAVSAVLSSALKLMGFEIPARM